MTQRWCIPHATVVPAALAVAEYLGGVSGRDVSDRGCGRRRSVLPPGAWADGECGEARLLFHSDAGRVWRSRGRRENSLASTKVRLSRALALASCQAVYSDALVARIRRRICARCAMPSARRPA